jgi:hypothetical protein
MAATSSPPDAASAIDIASAPSDLTRLPQWTRHEMIGLSGSFRLQSWGNAMWGTSASDLYIAAVDGLSRQYSIWHSVDAIHWTEQTQVPPGYDIRQVWGPSATSVYAAGLATLLHSSGDGNWSPVPLNLPKGAQPEVLQMWGVDDQHYYVSDVILASGAHSIVHVTPSGSTTEPLPLGLSPIGLWGSSMNDVYVSTSGANSIGIWHTDGGGTWTQQTVNWVGQVGTPLSIWGSGPGDVYFVANGQDPIMPSVYDNSVYHLKGGNQWPAPELSYQGPFRLNLIYVFDGHDVYAGTPMYHSSGNGNWTLDSTLNSMNDYFVGMWAVSPTLKFALAVEAGAGIPIIWIYSASLEFGD